MRRIISILAFLILTSCGESNSDRKNAEISVTTTADNTAKVELRKDETWNLEDQNDSIVEGNRYNPKESRQECLNMSFKKATLYNLTDTINADFNGDGVIDKAVYIKDIETSGIIIIHGKTNEKVKIGFGEPFAHMTEFDWVDYWGLVEDKKTSETTFDEYGDVMGSKDVMLQNPSIALGADELGDGLITFMNGKYVWIHQTC